MANEENLEKRQFSNWVKYRTAQADSIKVADFNLQ